MQNLTNDFEENYMMFIEKSARISEPGTSKSEKFRKLVEIVLVNKCICTRNMVRIKAAVRGRIVTFRRVHLPGSATIFGTRDSLPTIRDNLPVTCDPLPTTRDPRRLDSRKFFSGLISTTSSEVFITARIDSYSFLQPKCTHMIFFTELKTYHLFYFYLQTLRYRHC